MLLVYFNLIIRLSQKMAGTGKIPLDKSNYLTIMVNVCIMENRSKLESHQFFYDSVICRSFLLRHLSYTVLDLIRAKFAWG